MIRILTEQSVEVWIHDELDFMLGQMVQLTHHKYRPQIMTTPRRPTHFFLNMHFVNHLFLFMYFLFCNKKTFKNLNLNGGNLLKKQQKWFSVAFANEQV